MRRLAATFTMVVALTLAGPASVAQAHKPMQVGGEAEGHSIEEAKRIEDPQVSQVFYTELRPGSRADYWEFRGDQGEELPVQIGVPKIGRLEGFRPAAVLIGPSLPSAPEGVPAEVPEGIGAVEIGFQPGAETEEFFEPFSRTSSWVTPEYKEPFPASGEYYVAVYDPEGEGGKYWLVVGGEERFGPRDWLGLPVTLWNVRRFHEVSLWPDLTTLAVTVLAASLAAFVVYKTLVARKRRSIDKT